MSSSFDLAIQVVIDHEVYKKPDGTIVSWVDHPNDPGGETNWGISTLIIKNEKITAAKLGIDPATMFQPGYLKPMTRKAAEGIYEEIFWDRYKYGNINDQRAATKVFDCAVNCGPSRSGKMAQNSANACGQNVIPDGILGPLSFHAINKCDPDKWLDAMVSEMKGYYTLISIRNPKLKVFMNGWTKRAEWRG